MNDTAPVPSIDQQRIELLSDTRLYPEALEFVRQHPPPKQSQLMGLRQFSRTWRELKSYINHQRGRDWGRDTTTSAFYDALRQYLFGSGGKGTQPSLLQRITSEFALIDTSDTSVLSRQQQRDAVDAWAEALAAEFITHLVCASLVVREGAKP